MRNQGFLAELRGTAGHVAGRRAPVWTTGCTSDVAPRIDSSSPYAARRRRALASAVGRVLVQPLESRRLLSGSVVINEIHYAPDVATEQTEFIELTNPGDAPVDMSGANFTAGITYTFPNGTTLAPNAYLVVAQDLPDFQAKFAFTPLGPFTGKLSNDGETVTIKDSQGATLDTVTYQLGFPWPTVGDAPGYSIELINPTFDNNLGGNWRARG